MVLYRKVIDYSAAAGSRDQQVLWLSDLCMRLTEFGKAIGKGQGQESGADFFKGCVWAEADFASHCIESITANLSQLDAYVFYGLSS